MKCLVFYEMGEKVRYISHLDFLRAFTRAQRRSGLPVSYSQGFNPHAKVSFALPLSTGMTSSCEMLCIELDCECDLMEVTKALCRSMPNGINIKKVTAGDAKYFSDIYCVGYEIYPQKLPEPIMLREFLCYPKLLVQKKTKSGIKETDILPDVHCIELKDNHILAFLSAGNRSTLKPSLFMQALSQFTGYQPGEYKCHRQAIFDSVGNLLS